jgi:4-amino-4-deoxy-L-arabinose transferase-like glycosyltransferase
LDEVIDSSSASRNRYLTWALALGLLIYLPQIFWTYGHDQNVFAAIGAMILKGFNPYSELWDVKPPNVFYVYSIGQGLFGRNEMSVRLLDLASTLISGWLLFKLIENLLRNAAASWRLWSAFVAVIVWCATNLSLGLADTAQTESFSQPFLLGAFYLITKPHRSQRALFVTGLLISLAVFFKLTNLLFLPALILLELLRRDEGAKKRSAFVCIAVMLFGWLLGVAIQLLVLVIQGSFNDFFRVMGNVMRYHTEPGSVGVGSVIRIMWQYVDLYGIIALIGLAWSGIGRDLPKRALLTLAVLLLTSVGIVLAQGKGWGYHYVVMLAPLVGLTAIGIGYVITRTNTLGSKGLGIAALVTIIAIPLFLGPSGRRRVRNVKLSVQALANHDAYLASLGSRNGIYGPSCTEELTKAVEAETYARDRVFIFGHEPGVYWKTDRRPASRYVYTLLLTSPVIRDRDIEILNDEVVRFAPKLISVQLHDTLNFSGKPVTSMELLETEQFTRLREEIARNYELRDTVCGKFVMYRRKGKIES